MENERKWSKITKDEFEGQGKEQTDLRVQLTYDWKRQTKIISYHYCVNCFYALTRRNPFFLCKRINKKQKREISCGP
jgi:hypothetical protein